MKIKKLGETIEWQIPKDSFSSLAGKRFKSKVVYIDHKSQCYYVYAEYGQDYVPFNQIIQ